MTAPPAGALEACPFCGGEAELRGTATQRYVGCLTDLCVDGPYGDFDDAAAIAAWNRRAHGPALLDALRLRDSLMDEDIFTLIGHAEFLRMRGESDMPAYFFDLARRIAQPFNSCLADQCKEMADDLARVLEEQTK